MSAPAPRERQATAKRASAAAGKASAPASGVASGASSVASEKVKKVSERMTAFTSLFDRSDKEEANVGVSSLPGKESIIERSASETSPELAVEEGEKLLQRPASEMIAEHIVEFTPETASTTPDARTTAVSQLPNVEPTEDFLAVVVVNDGGSSLPGKESIIERSTPETIPELVAEEGEKLLQRSASEMIAEHIAGNIVELTPETASTTPDAGTTAGSQLPNVESTKDFEAVVVVNDGVGSSPGKESIIERSASETIPELAAEQGEKLLQRSASEMIAEHIVEFTSETASTTPNAGTTAAAQLSNVEFVIPAPPAELAAPSWITNPMAEDVFANPAGFTASTNPLATETIIEGECMIGGHIFYNEPEVALVAGVAVPEASPGPVAESYCGRDAQADRDYDAFTNQRRLSTYHYRHNHGPRPGSEEGYIAAVLERDVDELNNQSTFESEAEDREGTMLYSCPSSEHIHVERVLPSLPHHPGPVVEGFFSQQHYDEQMQEALSCVPGSGIDGNVNHLADGGTLTPDWPVGPEHTTAGLDSPGSDEIRTGTGLNPDSWIQSNPVTLQVTGADKLGMIGEELEISGGEGFGSRGQGSSGMPFRAGVGMGKRLSSALDHIKGSAKHFVAKAGMASMTSDIERTGEEVIDHATSIAGRDAQLNRNDKLKQRVTVAVDEADTFGTRGAATADLEQAPEEYYVLPQASGWAILETMEGGLHERGDLEEKFWMRFSWHAPYQGWLRNYIKEIGPEDFVEKPAFKLAAARGAANLVEYLDSTVPRAALESHLADTTWKAETAPGSGRRAALHLAIVNCDVNPKP